MKKEKCLVKDIKVGDKIELNLGYRAHTFDVMCEVLQINDNLVALFEGDDNDISFEVKEGMAGNSFSTCRFKPNQWLFRKVAGR